MNGEEQPSQFFEKLLFPKIFQTFRIAIHPPSWIIAFSALAVICLAGWILDFSNTVVTSPDETTELQIYMTNPDYIDTFIENYEETGQNKGVFSTLLDFSAARFKDAVSSLFASNLTGVAKNIADYFKAVEWALRYHFFYCIIFLLIKIPVLCIAGGGICRIAALQFAQGEKPGLLGPVRFSTKRFLSLVSAPLFPLGIIIVAGLCISLLGLIGQIPWGVGELIMGVFMLLALIAGILITGLLIGAAAGFNLMFPAIVYDGSDCLDAISRSLSYVYNRPWRMGFYTAVAAVYGAICYIFVRFFAFIALLVTYRFLQFGNGGKNADTLTALWPEPSFVSLLGSLDLATNNWTQSVAAFLIWLFLLVIVGLVISFVVSFYFSANTIIYSLLRNKMDNVALEDIYSDLDETIIEPTDVESESKESKPEPKSKKKKD